MCAQGAQAPQRRKCPTAPTDFALRAHAQTDATLPEPQRGGVQGEHGVGTPKRVAERLSSGIKRYQPILAAAKSRDVGEADTVTIVKDMLADVFGYDKYSELTSEHAIRGTYCDLATKIDGTLQTLIEVKAIGLELKDPHVKQAVDYATNQGVEWVLLTNGINWRVYNVVFSKPIEHELVLDLDFCSLSPRAEADIDLLYLWCKEGWQRSMLGEYHIQKQALSRFFIGAILLSEPVTTAIRRELRRLSPDVRIDNAQISSVLASEVIKREVMEGDKAEDAKKRLSRAAAKRARDTSALAAAAVAEVDSPVGAQAD